MSEKPIDPKPDNSDKPTQQDNSKSVDEKPKSKLSSAPRPATGRATGALKLPLNWDSLPDNKLGSSNSFLPNSKSSEGSSESIDNSGDGTVPTRENDDKKFFNFNKSKVKEESEKNPDTAVLSKGSSSWQKIIDGQAQGTTSTLGEEREVLFVIRGMIERVVMKENGVVTMGRFDTGTIPNEEIDLIPYGALDRGVSRRHCKIQLSENNLFVTDLQSTNGTFLAGVRLNPNESTVLRKGDELLLGRLAVQILFR